MAYRIYLADDDRFLLDMYAVKFRNGGHDVTALQGGEAALEALRKGPAPDALLLDIIMPGIDGFEVLETIKKENLNAGKIIVLSNQGAEADIDRATSLGAVGYIIKASAIPSEVYSKTIDILEHPAASVTK